MQNYTQEAMANILAQDATLVGWLAAGANSMYVEGDITAKTRLPFLVFEYVGMRDVPNTREAYRESWIIRLYDQYEKGYYNIEIMLGRIKRDLHMSTLILPSASNVFCVNTGVKFRGMTPRNGDKGFVAKSEGAMFDVLLFEKLSDA